MFLCLSNNTKIGMDMKMHYLVRYINCLLFMALAGTVILSCSDDEIAGKGKYAV